MRKETTQKSMTFGTSDGCAPRPSDTGRAGHCCQLLTAAVTSAAGVSVTGVWFQGGQSGGERLISEAR